MSKVKYQVFTKTGVIGAAIETYEKYLSFDYLNAQTGESYYTNLVKYEKQLKVTTDKLRSHMEQIFSSKDPKIYFKKGKINIDLEEFSWKFSLCKQEKKNDFHLQCALLQRKTNLLERKLNIMQNTLDRIVQLLEPKPNAPPQEDSFQDGGDPIEPRG
jgi:hypothetical protein